VQSSSALKPNNQEWKNMTTTITTTIPLLSLLSLHVQKKENARGDGDSAVLVPQQQQPFVQAVIKAGERDQAPHTNQLYRPKYRSRAAIITAEDF
jgi:hypothetical protein